MTTTSDPDDSRRMRCMEIRGGSQAVEESVSTPGLDAWVYSRPYQGAANGGDIYYLSLCGGGVITRIVVADVSGHGAEVAAFSDSLRTLMRKNINTKSQTRLVRALNQQFLERAQLKRFATAVVATYLATHQKFTVCNAGHPRPLWYRAAKDDWVYLDGTVGETGNLPLGIDEETSYQQFDVTLGRDDIILIYTDALTEAKDRAGHLLGEEGLLNLVRRLTEVGPTTIGSALLSAIETQREGTAADDDVTLMTFHHNASGKRQLTLGEKAEVYAKVFGLRPV